MHEKLQHDEHNDYMFHKNLEFFLSNRILCKQRTPYIFIYKQHWNESKHATTHFSKPEMLLGFYNRFCLEKNTTLVSPDAT
jgi:hypothetical protein